MMRIDLVRQTVLAIFQQHFPAALKEPEDAYFIDTGALDSFASVELISLIENRFGIKVEDRDVTEDNFGTISAVVAYARRRVGAEWVP